jgi:hypothetical protein
VNYHPLVLRSLVVVLSAVTVASAGLGVAHAEPAPCNYTLTAPQVVQLSGVDVVTATLSPAGCKQSNVYLSVACLQLEGGSGPGRCEQNSGVLTARVYYAPHQPGATYVATGRGCATTGNPPQPMCQPLGPVTARL